MLIERQAVKVVMKTAIVLGIELKAIHVISRQRIELCSVWVLKGGTANLKEAEFKSSELFHVVAETSSQQNIQEAAWLLLTAFRQVDSEHVEEIMELKMLEQFGGIHAFKAVNKTSVDKMAVIVTQEQQERCLDENTLPTKRSQS